MLCSQSAGTQQLRGSAHVQFPDQHPPGFRVGVPDDVPGFRVGQPDDVPGFRLGLPVNGTDQNSQPGLLRVDQPVSGLDENGLSGFRHGPPDKGPVGQPNKWPDQDSLSGFRYGPPGKGPDDIGPPVGGLVMSADMAQRPIPGRKPCWALVAKAHKAASAG